MKILSVILVFQILSVPVFSVMAVGGENELFEDFDNYYAKYYGFIKSTPSTQKIGIWTVEQRKIIVTRQTEIDEKFGRAEAGAYVEVEGEYIDDRFIAYEIEVMRENQQEKINNEDYSP